MDKFLVKEKLKRKQVFKYDVSAYDATYVIPKFVFKIVGVRLMVRDSNFQRTCWNIFYYWEFINVFVAASLEIINMILMAKEGSLINLIQMTPCLGYTLIVAMAKSFRVVYNRPMFENLVSELRDMWPTDEVTEEEYLLISKALKRLDLMAKGYSCCSLALDIIFTSPPFINIAKRLAGQDVPLILSFSDWFPFDPFQKGYYEIILIMQSWHCAVTVGCMLASDLLICVFLSHITVQFDLLAIKITRMFGVPVDRQLIKSYPLGASYTERTETKDQKYNAELAKIFDRHRTLIRLSKNVENMLSFSFLLNFLNSSIIICFCGFCVMFVEKWNEMIYKLFLLTAAAQVWLLCWCGQRLLDSSLGIADALYNSGWYTASKEMKKIILIMIHRSQKQECLTTWGFSIISLTSYSTIIKTSWSYFTLLINIYQ